MKLITLHPSSLLAGIGLTCLSFLAMAQNPQPINPTWSPRNPQPVVLLRDYVQIRQGTPYTVPPNKILMITAVGAQIPSNNPAGVFINNSALFQVMVNCSAATAGSATVVEVPRGLTANSGDIVTVVDSSSMACGVAWGFLADA